MCDVRTLALGVTVSRCLDHQITYGRRLSLFTLTSCSLFKSIYKAKKIKLVLTADSELRHVPKLRRVLAQEHIVVGHGLRARH